MRVYYFLLMLSFSLLHGEDFHLTMSERQAECIELIVHSLGEKSTGALMFSAGQLKSLGKEIDHVPPLEFLYTIYTNEDLYQCMKKTKERYFPWNAFISGFRDKCNRRDVYANVLENLESFCDATDLNIGDLSIYVANRDWKELVIFILTRR